MVKTEASHAFNIGSNPVRVTNSEFTWKCEKVLTSVGEAGIISKRLERQRFDIKVVTSHRHKLVLFAMRVHLFPSRTQKLSSSAPTILAG